MEVQLRSLDGRGALEPWTWQALVLAMSFGPWLSSPATGQAPVAALTPAPGFTRLQLDDSFTCEGASFADFDGDGHGDVTAGPWWWAGPDFAVRREVYPPQTHDPLRYSEHFFSFPDDIDRDGDVDLLVVGFPGKEARWYENLGAEAITAAGAAHWPRHDVLSGVDNESPAWVDLTGDGRSELVFLHQGRYGWAGPGEDPRAPWSFHPITPNLGLPTFTHGLGVGDIDGDGRADLVERSGWWRQPVSLDGDPHWERHEVAFAARGGAQMLVTDADGDGDADIVTSLDAHGFGLAWYEQVLGDDGARAFRRRTLMGAEPGDSPFGLRISELHALALADVDGDGLDDLVTGKRHWAHGPDGSPDAGAPSLLVWFRCVRGADGVVWEPRVIDADSGVGTQVVVGDVDGDGRIDVVVGNKQGAFLFRQRDALADPVVTPGSPLASGGEGLPDPQDAGAPSGAVAAAGNPTNQQGGPTGGAAAPAGQAPTNPSGGTAQQAAAAAAGNPTNQQGGPTGGAAASEDPAPTNPSAGPAGGAAGAGSATGGPAAGTTPAAQPAPATPLGLRPTAADGRLLNLGFETGDLTDWTPEGQAFVGQPVTGDTVTARGREASRHAGDHWIGGYEIAGDGPTGSLTSVPFEVTQPWASFLVGGGGHASTRAEILVVGDGDAGNTTVFRSSGANYESMQRVVVDLRAWRGRQIVVRLVDQHGGGWGHVNFDDFLFHEEEPSFERPDGVPPILPPDPVTHAGLRPEQAVAAMTVPAGFSVDLIAAEPDLHQPVALTTDAQGRLWVAEAHAYPVRVPDEEAADRLVVFADEDGDGSFETRTVFLEGLNLVSGLAVGHGGVWIGAAPYLMFVPDGDHDLVPDGPAQVLLDGWAWQDTHETLNAFTWGPDGWLYGCHGVFTHSRVGAPGTPDEERVPLNAGVWRFHPVRHDFEVFAWGTSNPWGIDFDAEGEAFITACVIPHLYQIVPGGRYLRQAGRHFGDHVYDDIDTIADHRHYLGDTPHGGNNRSASVGGGHAHCGALIYQGDAFPPEYRGLLLMNNIHGNRVNADRLARSGSGFVGSHAEDLLLANDTWFRGIALETGPDGAVYLIDWYDQRACHWTAPEVWDRTNGRLYRLSYGDHAPWTGDLTALADDELLALHTEPNQWFVRQARLELARRAAEERLDRGPTVAALRRLLNSGTTAQQQLEALWTLHVIGALDEDLQLSLLATADQPAVRAWTVRLGAESGTPSPELAAAWLERCADASPLVRRELASALQRLPDGGPLAAPSGSRRFVADAVSPEALGAQVRWALIQRLAAVTEDHDDPNIPLLLWYGLEPMVLHQWADARDLARHAAHQQLGDFILRRLAAEPDRAETVAETLAAEPPGPRRLRWLQLWIDALEARDDRAAPPSWPQLSARLRTEGSPAERDAALRLAARFGDAAAAPDLAALLADPGTPLGRRRSALQALARLAHPASVDGLVAVLDEPALRVEALAALARFERDDVPGLILQRYDGFDLAARRAALGTLVSREAWAARLLEQVYAGQVDVSHLSAAMLRTLRGYEGQALVTLREAVGIRDEASPAGEQALADWLARLTPEVLEAADPVAGRELFASTCQQCHTLFGEGGAVGPDLTGAHRGDLEYLLSNVLDPSAVVGQDYRATNLWLTDGRVLSGLLLDQSDAALTLRTETGDVTVPTAQVETRRLSELSLMADGLLDGLTESQVADLMAYLSGTRQVPRRATPERAAALFDGETLAGWSGDTTVWSVRDGALVGRTTTGLEHNSFLASDLELGDFRLTCEVLLVDDRGNSGIQFRSRVGPDGDVSGYQADIGPGWWGKLYEEHGRGLLEEQGGEQHVRAGRWNSYVIEARGDRLRTWLNGEACVDRVDPSGARRGVLALQVHSGGPTEVRFRDLRLELLD